MKKNPKYISIALGLIFGIIGIGLVLIDRFLSGIIVIQIGILFPVLHFSARVFLPNLAEAKVLFAGPKIGRIQGLKQGNKFIGFIDNIVEKYEHKNWHVEECGRVEQGRVTLDHSWWWRYYGVYPIGLNDVYTYDIVTSATEQENGKLTFSEPIKASSIYFHGTYTLISIPFTKDGIRLKVPVQIKTRTVNAATALSLPQSWTILVFVGVLATLRDFFGSQNAADLISISHEAGINKVDRTASKHDLDQNSGFAEMVRQLNYDTRKFGGNDSMAVLCGQVIESVTIIDIDFADTETEEAFWAPFEAERKGKAELIEADYRLQAADKNASTTLKEQGALATTYAQKVGAFGGDSKAAALVVATENVSKMDGLRVLGGNAMLNLDEKGGTK